MLIMPSKSGDSHRVFSITEGFTAVKQHFQTATHQKFMKESMENPDRIAPARQLSIMQAVKNQEEVTEQDRMQ